jgi:hypothetical protein
MQYAVRHVGAMRAALHPIKQLNPARIHERHISYRKPQFRLSGARRYSCTCLLHPPKDGLTRSRQRRAGFFSLAQCIKKSPPATAGFNPSFGEGGGDGTNNNEILCCTASDKLSNSRQIFLSRCRKWNAFALQDRENV